MRKDIAIDCLFVALLAAILGYQLLARPIVGMANNGDFPRMMESVGLSFVNVKGPGLGCFPRYYNWNLHARDKPFPSSELLFVTAGVALDRPFSRGASFDITSVGLVHGLAYLGAFALLALCLYRGGSRLRWLLYPALLLVFGDVAYVAYFNSLYAEAAALIFFCLTVTLALLAVLESKSDSPRAFWLIALFAAASLYLVAKLQNVMLGPFLALIIFAVSRLYGKGRLACARYFRGLGLALTVGLLLVTAAYWMLYSIFPMGIRNVNVYDSVFWEIAEHSPNPVADLKQLGLDESFLKYRGTTAWTKGITPRDYDTVYRRVGEHGIIRFYMRNPGRLVSLTWRAARHAFVTRPGYLGNFDSATLSQALRRSAPFRLRPGESTHADSKNLLRLPRPCLSYSFALVSTAKERLFGGASWPVLVFALVNVGAVGAKLWRFDGTPQSRVVSLIHASMIAMAAVQFMTVITGAGELDIVKHLFMFDLICDVCLVFLVSYGVFLLETWMNARSNQAKTEWAGQERVNAATRA